MVAKISSKSFPQTASNPPEKEAKTTLLLFHRSPLLPLLSQRDQEIFGKKTDKNPILFTPHHRKISDLNSHFVFL